MKKIATYCLFTIASIYLISCSKNNPASNTPIIMPTIIAPPPAFGFYVVVYFPSYRDLAAVPDIKFKMCNVVNYAFGTVNNVGGITNEYC
jgi:hypothetical protein